MIRMKGRKMIFTGKDNILIKEWAKKYDMSVHDFVIGLLWSQIMKKKQEELITKGVI